MSITSQTCFKKVCFDNYFLMLKNWHVILWIVHELNYLGTHSLFAIQKGSTEHSIFTECSSRSLSVALGVWNSLLQQKWRDEITCLGNFENRPQKLWMEFVPLTYHLKHFSSTTHLINLKGNNIIICMKLKKHMGNLVVASCFHNVVVNKQHMFLTYNKFQIF